MKSSRIKNSLIAFVVMLLMVSTVIPLTLGFNAEPTELDKKLANLAFYCTEPDGFNSVKYEHYKQQLTRQRLSDDYRTCSMVEPEIIAVQTSQSTLLSYGPMTSAWPMQSHDVHHTGQSPYNTTDNHGIEKWRFRCGWLEDTTVIDSDGTIYFGDNDGCLYALYPDGTQKWKYELDGIIWGSSPSIAEDGTIYVGSWDSRLYAINSDGTLKWRFSAVDSDIASSPVIGDDGTIYFGCMGPGEFGRVYAVNPNGTERWHYDTGYWIVSDAAIAGDGTIYIGSGDNYLYSLWPNGTLCWRFHTDNEIHGDPSIGDDGTIYIGSWDDYFYAINPDGSLKWKFNSGWGTSNSAAISDDGTIYVGTDKLYARYPDGSSKWIFDLGDKYVGKSSPAISLEGTVYIGVCIGDGDGGEIIAVNPDGTEKWRKRIADYWVESSPSIAEDGTVYIGSSVDMNRGYLHAFGSIESNGPPDAPSISGPSSVEVGEDYWYIFTAVDPDNNPIQLFVDWGDGSSGWVGEYASGEQIWVEHSWSQRGTYQIKAKVKDVMGEESGWGYLDVTVPVNEIVIGSQFSQMLKQHQNMFSILRYMLLNQ